MYTCTHIYMAMYTYEPTCTYISHTHTYISRYKCLYWLYYIILIQILYFPYYMYLHTYREHIYIYIYIYIYAHASKIPNVHTLIKARNLQRSVMSIRVHALDFEGKMHFSTRISSPVQKCWVVALSRRSDYGRYKLWVYFTSKLRINIACT